MKSNLLQRGILFNNYSELVFFATKLFKSDADMMLQVFRFMKGDDSKAITSDLQIFRDIRSGEAEVTDLINLFGEYSPELKALMEQLESQPIVLNEIGGWYILMNQLVGFKESAKKQITESNDKVLPYIDFLLAHCDLERSFLSNFTDNEKSNKAHTNRIINKWLLTDNLDIFSENKHETYEYLISIVLYWTALFEVYMHQEWGKENTTNLFVKYLPDLDSNNSIVRSNERCLISFKEALSGKLNKTLKWTDLSSIIAKARLKSGLAISANSNEVYSEDEPNQMILQKLKRWRKGYTKNGKKHLSFITIDDYKQYIAIIENKYDKADIDTSLSVIVLLQLWELLQFESEKFNIPNELVVDTFAKYPDYVVLVEKRFSEFEVTKELSA
jgi:hypothetical protein